MAAAAASLLPGVATGAAGAASTGLTSSVSLIAGAASAGANGSVSGASFVVAVSVLPGAAMGAAGAAGAAIASSSSLIAGAASAAANGSAHGTTVVAAFSMLPGVATGAAATTSEAFLLGTSLLPGATAVGLGAAAPGATVVALAGLAAGAASGAASVPAHAWQTFLAWITGTATGETAADPAGTAPGTEFAAFLALIVGEASGVELDDYPMKYATLADMVTRFGQAELVQLTDTLHRPPTTIDTTRVQIAIHDAQMEVDSAIGRIYRLPLAGCVRPPVPPATEPSVVAPPQLTRLTCDIARYFLYDDAAPEHEVVRRYKQARATLDDLASGTLQLACPWGGSPGELIAADAQSGSAEVYDFFAPRQITDDALRGF